MARIWMVGSKKTISSVKASSIPALVAAVVTSIAGVEMDADVSVMSMTVSKLIRMDCDRVDAAGGILGNMGIACNEDDNGFRR